MRLAVVTTHPIQYHSPWYRAMAQEPGLDLEVLYSHRATPKEQASAGFGVEFDWDQSLLDGYTHRFLRNVAKMPSISRFSGMDVPELSETLKNYDAVLVSGWHYKSAWQAIWACWRNKIPVMVRSDSHLHTERHGLKKLMKEVPYRGFISRLDACLPVGQWSREYFMHYGAASDRIFIVPHAVDDSFTQKPTELRNNIRKQWGLEADQIIFLFAGKFLPMKRPLDFVRAIQCAYSSNSRIAGLMVGDGPMRGEIQSLVDEFQLPIRFSGFLNQSSILDAYVATDALALTSEGETWGLVVNEAMSCARPCLVSDGVGCGPDLVLNGETGFTFPSGNVASLASHMVDCAAQPQCLIAMGKNARERIAQFSIPAAVQGVMDALARVKRIQ